MPTASSQIRRSVKSLYRWCLAEGRLDETRVREVVKHVMQSKHRGYLAVLGEFKRLVKLELAKYSAIVESPEPLQTDVQVRLRKSLEIAYGSGLTTKFAQNAELIGGIRLRVANDVYDNSVKSKLAALAKTFGIPEQGRVTSIEHRKS